MMILLNLRRLLVNKENVLIVQLEGEEEDLGDSTQLARSTAAATTTAIARITTNEGRRNQKVPFEVIKQTK